MSLSAGSIGFTGFNADGVDNLAFVVLQDIASGTVIWFTDNEWNGTSFNSGESTWSWTAIGDIAAGTVVTMAGLAAGQTATSNLGTIALSEQTNRNIDNSNEVVYAYVGNAASPTFVAAIANDSFVTSTGSLTNTGLVEGQTALSMKAVDADADIAAYNGPTSGLLNYADYLPRINNPANWISQDTSADNSNDGIAPDLPFVTSAFTTDSTAQVISFAPDSVSMAVAEGDTGSTTVTFTIIRSGDTTGEVSFSGVFVSDSSADAADFGGQMPASTFSGTIPDGLASATITVDIAGDVRGEGNEVFSLTLQAVSNPNASSVTYLAATGTMATATILNDDPIPSIAFVGFNSDGGPGHPALSSDNLAFVALSDITDGTQINFTNVRWKGSSLAVSEYGPGIITWTAAGEVKAGTVVTLDGLYYYPGNPSGTFTSSSGVLTADSHYRGLSGDNEIVYAFVGAPERPTFLTAIATDGFTQGGATLAGTDLVEGVNAINLASIGADADVAAYAGPRSGLTSIAYYQALINDPQNWVGQNTSSPHDDLDGVAPDAPFAPTGFSADANTQVVNFDTGSLQVSHDEGNDGTVTYTFTVERTGGTTGVVSFAGKVTSTLATADDFANAMTFAGTIADGATSAVVTVTVKGDVMQEGTETFAVRLQDVANEAAPVVLGNDIVATGTIVENDPAPKIAFTGWNTYNTRDIAFVALTNIEAGTTINFVANDANSGTKWNGSIFGVEFIRPLTWTATEKVSAGTVVTINDIYSSGTAVASTGTASGSLPLSDWNDAVFAYLGSGSTPSTFLAAFSTSTFAASGTTLDGTGLTLGVNAIEFGAMPGIAAYTGIRAGSYSADEFLALINDPANWTIQSGTGAANDGVTPDLPFSYDSFGETANPQILEFDASSTQLSHPEGDTGATALTFMIVRTGGSMVGDLSFAGQISVSTGTHDDDVAGGLATSFSGMIADGQNAATITIMVSGDTVFEADDQLTLTLTSGANPAANVILGGNSTATATIVNDDPETVVSGQIFEGTVKLTGTDILTVEAGGAITAPGHFLIEVTGPATGVVIDNSGTIASALPSTGFESDPIYMDFGSGEARTATINNYLSGVISTIGTGTTTAIEVTSDGSGAGTFSLNNAGQILSGGRGVDVNNLSGATTVVNNFATGVIESGGDQEAVRSVATVNNWGIIRQRSDDGRAPNQAAIDFQSKTGTVHNYSGGQIIGTKHAVTGEKGISVINDIDGIMIGGNGSAVNIDNGAGVGDTVRVTNYGEMHGRSANLDDSDGDAIDMDGLAIIDNYGLVSGEGHNGYHKGEANVSEAIAIGGGTITNRAGGAIYGYGRGIQVDNSSNGQAFAATIITNEGTIEGGGHGPTGVSTEHAAIMQAKIDGAEAINIIGDFDDTITNAATGKIIGGIFTDGGDDTLSNDGTITAMAGSAVNLGDGDDLLINRGTITGAGQTGAGDDEIITTSSGIFDGAVSMGDGDDKLGNSGKITGTVDMGTGDDVVNLYIGTNVTGTIQLGTGNDRLTADMYQSQSFTVDAGDGDDLVTTSFGNDVIHGGAGNDTIYASEGDDQAFGDDGDDLLVGEAGSDLLDGGAGNDRILAGAGDTVLGDAGDDTIELTTYRGTPASIDGGDGNDTLVLSGTGAGALLGTVVHVENLDVQSGNWWIKDAAGYSGIDVQSGAGVVLEGSADGMVVAAGGVLSVYGSAANSVISGSQYIQIGGSADGTTVAAGGEQDIYGGGTATNTNVDGGTQAVFGVATGSTIANGGIQHVHNNVFSTIVNDGGEQNVYVDGSANGTTINAGGLQIDWGFTITTTISGGQQFVFGSATLTTINSGVQTVQSGGTASETTIHGGEQDVYSGGTAINTTMDGGSQAVYGIVTQTIIGNGAIQYLHGSASLTTVNAGSQQNVYADGFAAGTTINAGGYQLDWGAASGTIVNGGEQYVFGSAIGTTVLAGTQHVQSGGSADDTTIGAGALAYVHAGGTIDDVVFAGPNATLVLDQAVSFTGTISGWQDHDSIDLGDILFTDGVTSLAYAANGDNSGGTLIVSDGTHTAALDLLGQYSAADFALSSDGHGGTLITDPGVVQQSQLAATLHG